MPATGRHSFSTVTPPSTATADSAATHQRPSMPAPPPSSGNVASRPSTATGRNTPNDSEANQPHQPSPDRPGSTPTCLRQVDNFRLEAGNGCVRGKGARLSPGARRADAPTLPTRRPGVEVAGGAGQALRSTTGEVLYCLVLSSYPSSRSAGYDDQVAPAAWACLSAVAAW